MEREPLRVLLVEDDEEDYRLTVRHLSNNGRTTFKVDWVRTYDAALDALQTPYDVCLVDYHLGAESGLALIAQVIKDGFSGPLILLTGRGNQDIDLEALRAGAADYLTKDEITPRLMERVILHAIERTATQLALRRSEEQLRQSQKMEAVGSLAGGVAHDFNNLLSVILSYSELLADELKPDDPMRADLHQINAAGTRAAALTRQLLAFSRQQVWQPRVVDLNDVVAGMDKMLRRLIGEDVELSSLPGQSIHMIMADPGQLEQVIMNLSVNGRDAMPKGGKLTIETANVLLNEREAAEHDGLKSGPHVTLAVTDTGAGMDKATQARMFEPFFTTKGVGLGTGLGLSTVFGIVKQSGGSIGARSELGKGTVFRTYFPATETSALAVAPSDGAADHKSLHGSETVLVVEDEQGVRALACAILRKFGYDVLEARSGGDALIVCEQHAGAIHLLLTDVVMPRMSGPVLAERLASTRPNMKVLYMSGYTFGTTLERLQSAGAAFLQKPIRPATLARSVRELLSRRPTLMPSS